MASGTFQLVVFSLVMFFGSYLAGSAPLLVSLSEEKLQRVSVLGAGLLVGTALAVIIPEGAQTLIQAYTRPAAAKHHGHVADDTTGKGDHGHDHVHDPMEGLDKCIGVSLVLGFVFMLLIDQISSGSASSNDTDGETGTTLGSTRKRSWTTTLGLVVHAAADGIALGAAATTNQTDVEIIVFLAIMLHKAPAAFGLSTFLLREGMDRQKVKKHLITFALSAPITAVLTFVLLHPSSSSIRPDGSEDWDTFKATGIAMLFSAGTFLYVATVHVLPEVVGGGKGKGSNHSHAHGAGFSKCDLLMLVIGTMLPMVLTLGHHH